ncbi:MAG: undecaprenyl-diphosphate phosphatase [Candidatus Tectomicrobia bacterium]|uniref:Undecaprenyl-diphosphatase n=1 Tax=Tectimicrobiota bacterium TaxID=2528274 RepID=A0A938B2Z7_UNCTE|nr:undecaprenyl-diphosphate phosphatase [Candidatus Tectomicrobia bacterium]
MTDWVTIVLLGIIEGLTEFLPVSSTGHLIIAGHLLGFKGERAATFEIFIQLGAILAVVVLYKDVFRQLFSRQPGRGLAGPHGIGLLALTTAPILLLGFLLHGIIKHYFFNNTSVVALGLAVGGVAMLLIERWRPRTRRDGLGALRWTDALTVGLCQCLALWPGTSRAASTILGGMLIGIERKTAAEYSFLAAVPALCAAVGYDLFKSRHILQTTDIPAFAVGFVIAFITAIVAIKGFIRLLSSHTLYAFGWYRLLLAVLIMLL